MQKSIPCFTAKEIFLFSLLFMLAAIVLNYAAAEENKFSDEARDAWIAGKLESAYVFNEHLNPFDIDIEVENGTVKLSGFVESEIDRDLAGEIAKGMEGVDQVDNQLGVAKDYRSQRETADSDSDETGNFSNWVSNASTSATVKTKLLANKHIDSLAVNVDTENGVVILSGQVESEEEKKLAEVIAANTENVKGVNNRLSVKTN